MIIVVIVFVCVFLFVAWKFFTAKGQDDEAIEYSSNDAATYTLRGAAYAAKRLYDEAIENYNKAIQLNPNYAQAYALRGAAYVAKRQYDRTIKDCSKAIQLNWNLAEAYYNRGIAYKHKEQFDKAISPLCQYK
jgi:tetratricopeptide (TPR) repeat protein